MEAFIGSIILFGGNFAPRGWALCQGQLLSISQNTALFSILGTSFGGDGRVTFGLPDLRGRVPVGVGQGPGLSNVVLGEQDGVESVTLLTSEIPAHNHQINCNGASGDQGLPTSGYPAGSQQDRSTGVFVDTPYATTATAIMAPTALSIVGSSLPHQNMQPYLGINYILCMEGIFPSRN